MDNKYTNNNPPGLSSSEDDSLAATGMRAADTLLRLVPMGLCIAALIVMLKNSEANDYGSVAYSDLGAFKYVCLFIFLMYMWGGKNSFVFFCFYFSFRMIVYFLIFFFLLNFQIFVSFFLENNQ